MYQDSIIGKSKPADCWPSVGPTVGRLLAVCQLTVGRQTNIS